MAEVKNASDEAAVDIFADFAVDDNAVWVPYRGDVEFLIARSGNPKFRRRIAYFYEKNRRILDGKGEAAEAKSNEIMAQVMAETILLGWKGSITFKGEKLGEYSREGAAKLLSVQLFREWVNKQAEDQSLYKTIKDEEDAENL